MSDGLTTLCRICYNSQQREKYKLKTQTRKKKKPKKKTKDIELEKILAPRTSFIRIIKPQPSKKEPLQFMHHQQYGKGLVVVDEGDTIKIKFADGIIRRIYREYLKETK